MKKVLILAVFLCLGSLAFAQMGMDASLGFQYGTARITKDGETLRKITEPGVVATFRMAPQNIGFFGRVGFLFPTKVTEGGLTLTYDEYNYILFMNMAFGASFKAPLTNQLTFVFDGGLSFNDMMYGGSFKDTIDARWTVKFSNLGTTYYGGSIHNVIMKESYNDFGIGIVGNAAMRFNFSQSFYLELGAAASFDFLRLRTYKFAADFRHLSDPERVTAANNVPAVEKDNEGRATELVLETNGKWNVFRQYTIIPSISVGYSF